MTETTYAPEHALPGGTELLFTILSDPDESVAATTDDARVAVLSLDTGEYHVVIESGTRTRVTISTEICT